MAPLPVCGRGLGLVCWPERGSTPPGQHLTVGWCSNAHVAAVYVGQACSTDGQVLARRLRLDSGLGGSTNGGLF